MIHAKKGALLAALLLLPAQLNAASPEFQIDLKELDRQQQPAPAKPSSKQAPKSKKQAPVKKEPAAKGAPAAKKARPESAQGEYVRYTVRPGDHIFKILVVRFGLSNEQAERLVPSIVEINGIRNIKSLEVGKTLLIPAAALHEHAPKVAKEAKEAKEGNERKKAEPAKAPVPAPLEASRTPEPVAEAPRVPEPPVAAPQAPAAKPVPAPLPKPAAAPTSTPASPPDSTSAPTQPPAPTPAPAPKTAPAKVAPVLPTAPVVPQAATWVCPVNQHDTASIVDSVLNALSAIWSRNRILHSDAGAATPFSIRVDRYFEYKGGRYIVSIGENDPYNYTLIRILETGGYRALMLGGKEDFKVVTEKLFKLVGGTGGYGEHQLQEGLRESGFLLQQDDAAGKRVLVTNAPPPAGYKWVMPKGCGAK